MTRLPVKIIDTNTGTIIGSVGNDKFSNGGGFGPSRFAIDPSIHRLYLAGHVALNGSGNLDSHYLLRIIDTTTNTRVADVELPGSSYLDNVAVNPVTHHVYVDDDNGDLFTVDGAAATLLSKGTRNHTGTDPWVYSPSANKVFYFDSGQGASTTVNGADTVTTLTVSVQECVGSCHRPGSGSSVCLRPGQHDRQEFSLCPQPGYRGGPVVGPDQYLRTHLRQRHGHDLRPRL